MSNKVKDNREEQRIEREANEMFPKEKSYDGQFFLKRVGYIIGAKKEAQRNKEDAIGFAEWVDDNFIREHKTKLWFHILDDKDDENCKKYTTEQLYEIYINQKV